MTNFTPFDMINTPLSGVNLVEASAGTGKTYAIVGVFLRLVVERGLDVERILVVTFTEAATRELKDRIRSRLRAAIDAFSGDCPPNDPLLQSLVVKHGDRRKSALARLRAAIRLFDQAAIFTIHGFCNRLLRDHAFESGMLFDTELVTSQDAIKQRIAADFWRNTFCRASQLFAGYAVGEKKIFPETFASLLSGGILMDAVKVLPDTADDGDLTTAVIDAENRFSDSFDAMAGAWSRHRDEVAAILRDSPSLNRNAYRKKSISGWIAAMDHYVAMESTTPLLFKGFEKFTTTGVTKGTKSKFTPEPHFFFDMCEHHLTVCQQLVLLFNRRITALKRDFVEYARKELALRKQRRNIHYFDDLVAKVNTALKVDAGGHLHQAVRTRYQAVLIDEFQDTDPIQYEIFSRLFAGQKTTLFYIGDPKQAIYGFRGADIFAYLTAARHTDKAYTLDRNWRSARSLVQGVNTLFASIENPFVVAEIAFHPVIPAPDAAIPDLTIEGKSADGIDIRLFQTDQFQDITTKSDWDLAVAKDTADSIAAMVNEARQGLVMLGNRPLGEADIAVLVRRHAEAEIVKNCLADLDINGIILKTGNLFDSHEAFEMTLLLNAVLMPGDDRLVKAALATDMMGWSTAAIDALGHESEAGGAAMASETVIFFECRDLWQRNGFIHMANHMVRRTGMLPRLMRFPDGERRCTNLFHLSEVLHQSALANDYGPEALVKWLTRQRNPDAREITEYPLRLESDNHAVSIITIHKSKGLEYPVVFVPFLWRGMPRPRDGNPVVFHDPEDNMRATVDFRNREEQRPAAGPQAEKEMVAEAMRLTYVAITRAKNRCCVAYVPDKATGSPLFELFAGGNSDVDINERLSAVCHISEKDGGRITVSRAGHTKEGARQRRTGDSGLDRSLACRGFSGAISREWRVSSFSFMSRQANEAPFSNPVSAISQMDENRFLTDEADASNAMTAMALEIDQRDVYGDITRFPKGAGPGLFMHEIFENLDFTGADPGQLETLVVEGLARYNFDARWQQAVCGMVSNVLSIPLPSPAGAESIRLDTLTANHRIHELEFYFPLNRVSADGMAAVYRNAGAIPPETDFAGRLGRLTFSPARGYMKGFMDLVFYHDRHYYLLDWKSNYLGTRAAAYHRDALYGEMVSACYLLQAHIYTVALNRYLMTRVPDYDYESMFGGIFYIYLRGVDPAHGPDYGIYREKPSVSLIDGLTSYLIDQAERQRNNNGA
ncbi:MAG: exodeoxyribonuclease V subunit beta [Thermodesulfobacteriota bacterium]|nr:exodeoxyribonuclease V subunit beta [Thermodesulfobacteriota bacterium]